MMARNHRYYLDILIGVVIHLYCHKDRNIFFFLDKKESKKSRLTRRGLKTILSAARKELAALKQLSASPASFLVFFTSPPLRPNPYFLNQYPLPLLS